MLGLPSAVTLIKDLDDAAAVAAARTSISSAPLITRTAATPQDSPKEQKNNTEWSPNLQLPYTCAVITYLTFFVNRYSNVISNLLLSVTNAHKQSSEMT